MPKKPMNKPETEVVALPENDRRQRRRFTREEKVAILKRADAATGRGEVAALLRREGLYSSHLTQWRQQVREHGEAGLDARRPGAKPQKDERDQAIEKLERKTARLEHELLVARKLIELAGKAHEILGVALPSLENDETL
ncbi:MAG: helix-turn-helix domain-containing protein [Sandaracinaceae bacterium]|nr:helix-turn-helix domain-containing protein [Sandaracinaceae bacterium]